MLHKDRSSKFIPAAVAVVAAVIIASIYFFPHRTGDTPPPARNICAQDVFSKYLKDRRTLEHNSLKDFSYNNISENFLQERRLVESYCQKLDLCRLANKSKTSARAASPFRFERCVKGEEKEEDGDEANDQDDR